MSVRIGVEVGGTFTDIVCLDEERQNLGLLEVPTTPRGTQSRSRGRGIENLRESDLSPLSIQFLIHGTTVATNAILERVGELIPSETALKTYGVVLNEDLTPNLKATRAHRTENASAPSKPDHRREP